VDEADGMRARGPGPLMGARSPFIRSPTNQQDLQPYILPTDYLPTHPSIYQPSHPPIHQPMQVTDQATRELKQLQKDLDMSSIFTWLGMVGRGLDV